MYKILIVEDDTTIANIIKEHLASWGMITRCVTDFGNVLSDFAGFSPHLVLIDISLPFYNGYHWCSEIRKISQVPIIFISSASDNMNIVMAINMGADDFIAKPFDLTVLVAKVQALLRRTYDFTYGTDVLEHKGVILNLSDCSLVYQGNKLDLTKNEHRILQVLLEQRGKVVSRDTLMYRLWETDDFVDENTLTVNMARLRKKLASVGIEEFIITKKGLGYMVE
ncbi:response regulator transcription factor [Acetivibrio straminisolvens]|jgi:DNA-binding response OmpR family regulator|nr:response regulator transcription factor [Acetivibrio straminisolvens]